MINEEILLEVNLLTQVLYSLARSLFFINISLQMLQCLAKYQLHAFDDFHLFTVNYFLHGISFCELKLYEEWPHGCLPRSDSESETHTKKIWTKMKNYGQG
jgi:hypothetical protein